MPSHRAHPTTGALRSTAVALACVAGVGAPCVAAGPAAAEDPALTEYVPLLPGAEGQVNPTRPPAGGHGGAGSAAGDSGPGTPSPASEGPTVSGAASAAARRVEPAQRATLQRLVTDPALGAPAEWGARSGDAPGSSAAADVGAPTATGAVSGAVGGLPVLAWLVGLLIAGTVGAAGAVAVLRRRAPGG